jgi:rfaE bifunctional protein nucleotidyltransferase chain/domain
MLEIEHIEEYTSKKIVSLDEIKKIVSSLKEEGKKVGMCHGGFDLLHPGHVKHFESAKALCDVLVVSITSQKFVSKRKGSGRPIYSDELRSYITAGIEFVDYVVITDFQLGVDVIHAIKPSYYIKGPDFINKTTPGINSERQAIKDVGGEIKYTNDPTLSTTSIIKYIKEEVDSKDVLVLIDRDGTLVEDVDFLGRNENWTNDIKAKKDVISFLSYLQTKYQTTKIVVSNQTGVARRFFTCEIVEKINAHIDLILKETGVKIDNWQYCPDADKKYSDAHPDYNCDPVFVKENTKRKPSLAMAEDGLKAVNKTLKDFAHVIVIGDRHEDAELAENASGSYLDANLSYDELVAQAEKILK